MSHESVPQSQTTAAAGIGGEHRSPQEVFRELWSQALLTVGGAEEEVRRVLERLSEVMDFRPDDLQRHGRELAEKLRSQRTDLEASLEDGIKRTLLGLRLPTPSDLEALRGRIDDLGARVQAMEHRRSARPRKPSKPRGKS